MRFTRVRPGDAVTARQFNELLDALERALALSAAPPLVAHRDATGTRLALTLGLTQQLKRGVLTADLAYGGSATCNLRAGPPGDVEETGEELTVYDDLLNAGDDDLLTGGKVVIARFDGYWWVIAVVCPGS